MNRMDDTISRQAAIDAFFMELCFNKKREYAISYKGIEKIINGLPSAEPERWIPCRERMPDKEGLYLITCIDDSGALFVDASLYDPPTDRRGAIWDFPNVVAWMERPGPYKEGAEE